MLRSPWLGVLAIVIAGIAGYALSNDATTLTLDEVTVSIRATKDAGTPWDFGGGLPDPKIAVDNAVLCETKDQLKATCRVGKPTGRRVHVVVVDIDSSDDDPVGEVTIELAGGRHTTSTTGALESVETVTSGGGGPWQRFRALWVALAIGFAVAGALALYRRKHA